MNAIIPSPRVNISIRAANNADIPAIDRLQKLHANQVGWMPQATLEGKIRLGHVFVAEKQMQPLSHGGTENTNPDLVLNPSSPSVSQCLSGELVGYVIGNDQYFKRDDVGIIYQMNVDPQYQRGYVGAALLKAQFERSAYGCRLYCCWCAKDISANKFWESLGFVPLAFRAGSTGKKRIHIFWQKRIREGDTTTPYWYPSKTDSGAMREDRVVLPIPPGTHWSEVHAPEFLKDVESKQLSVAGGDSHSQTTGNRRLATRPKREKKPVIAVPRRAQFGPPGMVIPVAPTGTSQAEGKPKREPKPQKKLDPQIKQAARELRDRWLEQVNNGNGPVAIGKYDLVKDERGRMKDEHCQLQVLGLDLPAAALPSLAA